jgi:hypothetical protein
MAISSSKDFIVFPNDNSGRLYINEAIFTASGTWTAPTGVTSAQVILVGGGGGGGGGSQNVAGGGGAGGQVIVKNLAVTPGTTYSITVGAGGQGGQGAINSATDVTNTLPGGNGSATIFGNVTIANLLVNPDFDYNISSWDSAVFYRYATGISGQSAITVYPNANGLATGQFVSGTSIGTNAQVVSISGNVATLSVANSGTVASAVGFGVNAVEVRPSNVFFYNVSSAASEITNNTQTVGVPGSPYFNNLSNNLMQPEVSQLEEAAVLSNNYLRQYGTALSSFSITNAGVPTKLAEMIGGYTKTATAALTSTTVTLDSTTNVFPGMYITSSGGGFASGTTILSVNSATQITISATTTQVLNSQAVTISYSGAFGINGLIAGTSSSTSAGAPTWVQFSTMNSSTTSNGTQTATGFQGIPYIPGQSYTFSAYISTNVNISTSTPILFQIRSSGASWNAISSTSYLGGTNSGTTNSIDAGQTNGFFVRQTTPATLTNYGGAFGTTASGSNGASTITVADATGILIGMAVTGSGIQANTVVSNLAGTTVTLNLPTNAPLSTTAVTFANPSGVQMLGSNVTVGQNGWRRLSATFTTPTIATALANGQYAWGSTPQFIHPVIVFQQPSVNYWIDNLQLEAGNTATAWRPPVYREAQTMLMRSNSTTGANLETTHRFVKVTPSVQYSGSAFVVATGTSNQYRPVRAFIEYFDADYNSLLRTEGSNTYLPISGVASSTQQMPGVTYPVRVGVNGALAPVGTVYAKFGVMNLAGAQTGTAGQVEYHIIAPQLEPAAVASTYKKVDNVNYFYSGQAGLTPIVSSLGTLASEGGGGGGTYNSNSTHWQFGMEGANSGGHAAVNSNTTMTLAGGGAGAGGIGEGARIFASGTASGNTTDGYRTTAAQSRQLWPLRGHQGGYAAWNAAGGNTALPAKAGDGGAGVLLNGLNSGSPLGIPLGGGGGGAGWQANNSATQGMPGYGNNGGGKGAPTWLYNQSSTGGDYYARGIDAIQNTGGGGGGGASNWTNLPNALITHTSASAAVNYEAITAEYFKWTPVYNATIALSAQAGFYGSNVLRVTVQDTGNAKLQTVWQTFPIMPRIALVFPGVAARLTTAPGGVTSAQFTGLPKRVRPTVRWKDDKNTIIREDRPGFDIQFSGTNTVTYLGASGATSGVWQTLKAPANASFFDVTWELLYMDAGDVVDLDLNGCQYYGYDSQGGNGADGFAMIRWFDKAVL